MFASEERRLAAVVRALVLSLLICIAFSWRLWISTRLYPLAPALGVVPRFPWPLDLAALALLVGLLAGLAVKPLSRPFAAAAAVAFAVLFAQDQSRLWPSFYLFWFLLLILLGHRGEGDAGAGRTLAGMRFAVAMAYFWGGVQKLTPRFFHAEFPWFIEPLTDLLPGPLPGIPVAAAGAAVFEALLGIGLLTRRFRRVALLDALAMHAVVFVCIGPLRGNWNDSAWIWSQTMTVLLVLLFRAAPPFRFATLFAAPPAWNLPAALAVVCLGVLPVLDNVNRWDSALSFNVYTGNVRQAFVILPGGVADRLPPEIAAHVTPDGAAAVLDMHAWSMHEFNAGVYPATRVFRAIFADLCARVGDPSIRLLVLEKEGWFIPASRRIYACGDP